jgi:hypothetical protein
MSKYSKTSLYGDLYNKGSSLVWTPGRPTDRFLLEMSLSNKGTSHFWAVDTIFRPHCIVEPLLHGHI